MIIIFGLRRLRKAMGPVMLRCANCGMSPLALFRVSTWFALFFIPVIPVSFKHYTACPNCKRVDQVPKADVERARAHETAIATPADGSVAVAPEPATLEHAVNQWASGDHAHAGAPHPAAVATPAPLTAETAPPPLPPAGWYPDPAGSSVQRYWDGQGWTDQTAPTPPTP